MRTSWLGLLTALVVGGAAFAQGDPQSLVGLDSTFSAQVPEQTPDHQGPMSLVDHTQVLSATADQLVLQYSSVLKHSDGGVFTRVSSRVTVPLKAVTLTVQGPTVSIVCNDGSSCVAWVHSDFYREDGATFGNSGGSAKYAIALDPTSLTRFLGAVCPYSHCQ